MVNTSTTSLPLIEDYYKRYRQSIKSYISFRVNNKVEAEDLVQDTFLRLMDYKLMLREETIQYFLFAIARNIVTDYLRRLYKLQEVHASICELSLFSSNEVESQIISDDIVKLEKNQIAKLPSQRRRIYMMSRFEEKTISEISSQLNLSQRTVENHLFIGRKEIRANLLKCI